MIDAARDKGCSMPDRVNCRVDGAAFACEQ